MKAKVLPVILNGTALTTFAGIVILGKALALKPLHALIAAWVICIPVAWLMGSLAITIKPDLRFSTRQQIDGLGYFHQPMNMVVNMTLLAILCGIVLILKR
jgi:hypothetical protein